MDAKGIGFKKRFLAANRHALEYFGASTRRAMRDNLKTAVLKRLPGYAPVFNPRYLDFAAHYGFKSVACNVGSRKLDRLRPKELPQWSADQLAGSAQTSRGCRFTGPLPALKPQSRGILRGSASAAEHAAGHGSGHLQYLQELIAGARNLSALNLAPRNADPKTITY
jgi:hypothetical protein